VKPFHGSELYGHLPPDKVVALCTGSQGEPRAALARIAEDEHPEIAFSKGDRVIFSSRPIPGNEQAIGRVINGLVNQGIEVITDRTHLVHVSGHPRLAEMEDLLGWVKPRTVIPVHGEALHLGEHAALARRLGANVLSCRNGDLVRIAPGEPKVVDEMPAGRIYKDGRLLVSAEARTVADRKRLSFAGVVIVSLAMTDKGVLAADPEVELIGIPEHDADGEPMADAAYDAAVETFDNLPKPRRRDPDSVEEAVRRGVRAAVAQRWCKKPQVSVHILMV
jgi:ribonuclease J